MWQIKKFFFFFLAAFLLGSFLFIISKVLTVKLKSNIDQLSEYECGFDSFDTATRQPFDVKFYLIGLLFVLFDVEIATLFPWAFNFFNLTWLNYFGGCIFLMFVGYGIMYEWKNQIVSFEEYKKNAFKKKTNSFIFFLILAISSDPNSWFNSQHIIVRAIIGWLICYLTLCCFFSILCVYLQKS